eukprot:Skav209804  [mRNA]  locus=scaffold1201:318280:327864:- [translate_table: standard]
MAPYDASEEVAPPFQTLYFSDDPWTRGRLQSSTASSKEFMSKYEPLATANRKLKEDKNDKEAQKTYDEHFPLYKNYAACWLYLAKEYLKRVSLKRNPEPFTFCFAGRTPSRVADLRDREFAGTQIDCCISMGVHYCDISGEIPWSRRITPLNTYAQRNKAGDAFIIPSAASAGGFPDLCTFLCAKKAHADYGDDLRKAICYVNGGGAIATPGRIQVIWKTLGHRTCELTASGGTLKTRATMAAGGDETRKMMGDPYALGGFVPDRDRHGIKYCNIEFGTGKVTTKVRAEDLDANMSKISEDKHLGIWRGPNVYSYFDTRIEMLLQQKGGGGGAGGGVGGGAGGGGGGGSVEAERKALEAPPGDGRGGHEIKCDFIGRDGYFETARIAVETLVGLVDPRGGGAVVPAPVGASKTRAEAMSLVFDQPNLPFPGGVLTPAVACGEALARRLIHSGVKFKMGEWHGVEEFNPPPNP